jgi:tetratricopeptide (TPR) repeat protein
MKKHVSKKLIYVALVACIASARAAVPTSDSLLAKAEHQIEAAQFKDDLQALEAADLTIDQALALDAKNPWAWYYKGWENTISASLGTNRTNPVEMGKAFEKAKTALDKSLELKRTAEALALHAGVLGSLIATRGPDSAMVLGPQSGQEMGEALSLSPDSPQVLLGAGLSAIFTPPEFGGDVEQAAKLLKQSLAIFAKGKRPAPLPNWGEVEAHVWLGQAEQKLGHPDQAKAEFDKALELAPNYGWVKYVLLPGVKVGAKTKS